ncbi:phospho-N-acetylmuramoyl-pentapeptide-transferase [Phaeocystidibacter luteus]|uniref:Phospho-N-acetylmuramoyl-pentapeptide-transferase n=1 Tax=Phaeocystidibacter luteus TaxID=911197 RepID=A0A6N6RKN9_9FLAO|nr:phospho-N-acetylmuramoyl-pentapeptide-transferase [Phaeocystidibacter luteus]KAB2813660.1 phospho-N-acetylmuramoyl-pentapeptide-transferase [Phaeocystidibacter luteus]
MLTYLFEYLQQNFDFPGAGLFQYISFRAAMAVVTSLIVSMIIGKRIIRFLQIKQIGETVRQLGLQGEDLKKGTPTMGGIIILAAILIPVLLFARLENVYIQMLVITTLWMGTIGFIDDYIKVFKKNKEGLRGKFKVIGQVGLGIIIGSMLYFHPDVTIKEEARGADQQSTSELYGDNVQSIPVFMDAEKSTKTTIPFFKNNEFDYNRLITWIDEDLEGYTWIIFIPIIIFIITAVSNGANLTDGLDGLATGTSAIVATALAVLAYVSGSVIFADYFDIMYIPFSGEMVIFAAAFIGACIGFLWYNSYPAQVFMGDTGSLAIGAIIAVFAIAVRKELLIPILCGVFLIENLSVIMQVSYFKYTKKRTGTGKRIFLMSPLHHHYQKKGYHEAKIVNRFWIVSIMLAVFAIITLKLR